MTSVNVKALYEFDTVLCADSVEWCPHHPLRHVFVCANYHLEEQTSPSTARKKIGKIKLFTVHHEDGLKLRQTIDTPAVLDQKWCHNKIHRDSLLGVVNAENQLQIYRLWPDPLQLKLVTSITNHQPNVLFLSLDWSTGKYFSLEPKIICSDSKGSVHVFLYDENGLTKVYTAKAHDYEAWICAFYYWSPSVFFTGGDDCKLLQFDFRADDKPMLVNQTHSAGVTCLHSNKDKEHLLTSGSYDSNLFVWDVRKMKNPLKSVKMPGTLWRLKWNPYDCDYLLTACMKDGFHIVNADTEKIVADYHKHEDLAYGVDWSYLDKTQVDFYESEGQFLIAACSFYDHKLSVAKVNLCDRET